MYSIQTLLHVISIYEYSKKGSNSENVKIVNKLWTKCLLRTNVELELWLLLEHFSAVHYWGPVGVLWYMPFLPHRNASEMTMLHQALNNPKQVNRNDQSSLLMHSTAVFRTKYLSLELKNSKLTALLLRDLYSFSDKFAAKLEFL